MINLIYYTYISHAHGEGKWTEQAQAPMSSIVHLDEVSFLNQIEKRDQRHRHAPGYHGGLHLVEVHSSCRF